MDNRGKRQSASIFGGMGFYIALLVCVIAAGVVGYFALLRSDPEPQTSVPSSVTDQEPAQSVSLPKPEPAKPVINDTPITVEKPTVRPIPELEAPAPEIPAPEAPDGSVPFNEDDAPVMEPAPIEAVEPMIIVQPLAGETAAAFSVDQLVYSPTLADWRTHDGVDISAAPGSTVLAATSGTVASVEDDPMMGTTVTIDHEGGYTTVYANLQAKPTVLPGDLVTAGQIIGAVGSTAAAEAAQSPHLHFSVTQDGEAVDPSEFLGR